MEQNEKEEKTLERPKMIVFDRNDFIKLVINDLSKTREGRSFLKKYKQSEVREIVENYKIPRNQEKLKEISTLLYAKSQHYQRLIKYFAEMPLFSYILAPIKNIREIDDKKVLKQYIDIAELLKLMNIPHEMKKVLNIAFLTDVFYGYIHMSKNDFYIQRLDDSICQISSVQDGIYNFSVDMSYFQRNEDILKEWPTEVQLKYKAWKQLKDKNSRISPWVELDAQNTICIKINEEMLEVFPPFAGSFDAIFDIEAFKALRKDREELSNYMLISQKLPMREDSDSNNDFLIDKDMMMFFHNMINEVVPESVGVVTSPMELDTIKFEKDTIDKDGVAKAERDFWSSSGTSQLLFNADKTTSQGLKMSIKTDEEIIFGVLKQIERWINRFLKFQYKNLMFNVNILPITYFNKEEMFDTYMTAGQYGVPVKNYLCAVVGLSPIETMNNAYLENVILKLHTEFIPLLSSHTLPGNATIPTDKSPGAPQKDDSEISDETARGRDKPTQEN